MKTARQLNPRRGPVLARMSGSEFLDAANDPLAHSNAIERYVRPSTLRRLWHFLRQVFA